jgi:hypothetical protein
MTPQQYRAIAEPKLIEATGDPLAPEKLMFAHQSIDAMARMLAGQAEESRTIRYNEAILGACDIERVLHTPEYILALSTNLCDAIVSYIRNVMKETSK